MYTPSVQTLIDELARLPGIGPKSAQRIAFYILKSDKERALRLADAIVECKEKVSFCESCFNLSESRLCGICSDKDRDRSVICLVEEPRDVIAIEKTKEYRGLYHVLGGVLNPIDGIGPDKIRVRELLKRLSGNSGINEVIVCTNPNLEGEATALYLARLLADSGITVSRLASGLPVGGDLEYADELTLGRALVGRRVLIGGER
ncbi:DNA replication and repair protein RecR [Ferrithrix thermotolerans DSM 19514]|jgi:recombination protein RecR|uniref:Recombination protein RecR n=1 Tax=Ferrithrix thermotolerans DSM 19514 TaxID=1121881 RepID=A0A1M4UZN8_9ACTN|nr:recombination mediator RecR [Ferrithrix thermotolerans]SHE62108.1 DNA replication and repair protein RecR [Ferrithrix thermotolerans DSM 19514]